MFNDGRLGDFVPRLYAVMGFGIVFFGFRSSDSSTRLTLLGSPRLPQRLSSLPPEASGHGRLPLSTFSLLASDMSLSFEAFLQGGLCRLQTQLD